MHTLFLDTSGPWLTVVISRMDKVLEASTLKGRPAAHVHEQIRLLLHKAEVGLHHVEKIAVITGPGSWTGLNIGVTAAKMLAHVLGVRILPLSSLDIIAAECTSSHGPVCAMLSAGRGRVYRAWYQVDDAGDVPSDRHQRGVVTIDEANEEVALHTRMPLVVEYGSTIGASIDARCTLKQVEKLSPQAMVAASAHTAALSTQETLWLTPDYMQPSMVERDAAPSKA